MTHDEMVAQSLAIRGAVQAAREADAAHADRYRELRAEYDAATAKLLEVAEKMADGCTVGNFGPLQNRLRARSKAVRTLRAKLGIKP